MSAALAFLYVRFVVHAPPGAFEWQSAEGPVRLLEPKWLAVLLAAPLLLFVLGRSLADLPWEQRLFSWMLRLTFLGLLGVGLGRVVHTEKVDRVCAVALVDVSDSISDESLEAARKQVEGLLAGKRADDELRLVTFAERAREVPLGAGGGAEEAAGPQVPPLKELRHDKGGAGTDLRSGLEHAYAALGAGCLPRVVVISDGVETRGSALSEAARARAQGIVVDVAPIRAAPPADVAVTALEVPSKVTIGEPFEVTARLHATRPGEVRLRLYQGDTLNGLDSVRTLSLAAGDEVTRFRSVVRVGGEVTYSVELEPTGPDAFADNNRAAVTVDVPGRPAVLLVEGQAQGAQYLSSALSAQQFDVDVRQPGAFPGSLGELERFAFVIVSDTARDKLGRGAENLIERYVRDIGGGFLFAGGTSSYSLGGWQGSELEKILPVRMESEKRREMPGVAMVLVIDRSGSMTGLPMEMAKQACSATVATLQPDDLISVIAFDSQPARYVKLQPARYRSRIQSDILRIQPGGGTEIFSSLDMAYQDIAAVEARKKHVILLTDGNARSDGIYDLVTSMLAENITVTTVGLGTGINDELLRMIADAGGGRYHNVPDPNSLPRVFTREAELISKEATVEDWFPVRRVGNAAFLRGIAIDSAPLLRGYVSTSMKPSPAELILASDRGEPILARTRVGLGWSLAWTSDIKNNWAVDWLRWPEFGRFWAGLVREHMRGEKKRELPMEVRVEDELIVATVQSLTDDERFDSSFESTLRVRRGKGRGAKPGADAPIEVPFELTAPGRYEARVKAPGYGSFVLDARHSRRDADGVLRPVGVSYGHASLSYPREYAAFEPNVAGLEAVARAGGGQVDPKPAAVFDPQGKSIERSSPRQNRFILAALVVFLLDLLVRRVRLFDRGFKRVSRAE
jgi:Mg-chelatase subunit ChlD